jgi:hypothetical protein
VCVCRYQRYCNTIAGCVNCPAGRRLMHNMPSGASPSVSLVAVIHVGFSDLIQANTFYSTTLTDFFNRVQPTLLTSSGELAQSFWETTPPPDMSSFVSSFFPGCVRQ